MAELTSNTDITILKSLGKELEIFKLNQKLLRVAFTTTWNKEEEYKPEFIQKFLTYCKD